MELIGEETQEVIVTQGDFQNFCHQNLLKIQLEACLEDFQIFEFAYFYDIPISGYLKTKKTPRNCIIKSLHCH